MRNKNIYINSFEILKEYCESQEFKGWDPFDGLNSPLIQNTFFGKLRIFRLAWIQLFKRNPINLRTLVGIKKEYNPKGLGLFLSGYCNLHTINPKQEYLDKIDFLGDEILKLQTKGYSGACWGYNFDWQARAFFQPEYTPTIVATTFIVEALLKAYDITGRKDFLETALSSTDFVLRDLNKSYDDDNDFTLSYSPLDNTQVFNAGLLGAKLLCLVYKYSKDKNLLKNAKSIVAYVSKKQGLDGSWAYGTLPFHQWIDNFHTGYNLECIHIYQETSGDYSYRTHLEKGTNYYLNTFFTNEGVSKYYNDKTYPVDIHSPAQLVVTLNKLGILEDQKALVDKVMEWTIENMQSPKGFFYHQKHRLTTSKTPYIRWAQAWMFYAFSHYFSDSNNYE